MRIAVLSDVHAKPARARGGARGSRTVDAIWHLGDVVGYGPRPDEVVDRLRQLGAVGVRGNHDSAALDLELAEWFNPDARRAIEWTAGQITPATRDWLARLPERLEIEGITLVHGSPRDPTWEYITTPSGPGRTSAPSRPPTCSSATPTSAAAFRDNDGRMEAIEPSDGSTLVLDARRVLANPGSVGQPRDGDSRASAAILDTSSSTLTWHRVAYEIAATQADIRARGLPGWLADRLAGGR